MSQPLTRGPIVHRIAEEAIATLRQCAQERTYIRGRLRELRRLEDDMSEVLDALGVSYNPVTEEATDAST